MGNLVKKVINCQVKEMPDHMMEFVGSCGTADRMGDRVHADGWQLDNYKKNPIFLWAHDYKQLPIGKAIAVAPADDKLMFRIQFANHPFAETVYQLYKGGFLNAVSVGFAPIDFAEYQEDGKAGYDYNKQELLELSAVPVPAHPDALVTARGQGLITVKEFEMFSKRPPTQAEVRDEIDFLGMMIAESGIADGVTKENAIKLANTIWRITGCDNPESIQAYYRVIHLIDTKLGC